MSMVLQRERECEIQPTLKCNKFYRIYRNNNDFVIIYVKKDHGKQKDKFRSRYESRLLYVSESLEKHFNQYLNKTFRTEPTKNSCVEELNYVDVVKYLI